MIDAWQDILLPRNVLNLKIPCFLVGRSSNNLQISAVGGDEEKMAFDTQYLMNLGHSSMAFIGGNTAFGYTFERINGFKNSLLSGGIKLKESWISLGEGDQAAEAVLKYCPEISAAIFDENCKRYRLPTPGQLPQKSKLI